MNNYKIFFFLSIFFTVVSLNRLRAQNSIKTTQYLERKIITVLEYHMITGDSVEKKYNGLDSLMNNSERMRWETLLELNKNGLIVANRVLKRIQVAYLNQPKYFFDSSNPTIFSGFLSVLNEISDRLINKTFKEVIPFSTSENNDTINNLRGLHLYKISPYDTINYVQNLFLLEKIPLIYKENDKWGDTLIAERAIHLNFFSIKSISKNNLILFFKSSVVALNHKRDNQNYSNNDKVRINIFENSTITEGYIDVDPNTHFIYSIKATTTRKMESNINETQEKSGNVISKFSLYNRIE
jgi:hypothetical protein